MTPQFESPNGLWRRLGYTIERCLRGERTILRPDGSTVSLDRHTGENKAARQEPVRLPHVESESQAAQLDIFV